MVSAAGCRPAFGQSFSAPCSESTKPRKALVSLFRVKIYRKKSAEKASSRDGVHPALTSISLVSDVGNFPSSVSTGHLSPNRGHSSLLSTSKNEFVLPTSKSVLPPEFPVAFKSPSPLSPPSLPRAKNCPSPVHLPFSKAHLHLAASLLSPHILSAGSLASSLLPEQALDKKFP